MKRAFAFLLALALVLTLSTAVFAAEEKGTITITNATIGQTYRLFKIFDATYAVDEYNNVIVDANGDAVVSYTIETTNQFFDDMFGVDGTATNPYFIYESATGVVTKRAGVTDTAVIEYLTGLASSATPESTITADSKTVEFKNVDTGYYLIDRGIASTVTITSNMPNVDVIDKNQKPNEGDSFSKLVYDEDTGTWVKSSIANVGDIIEWNISFKTTNYDGDDVVLYYSVRDIKSSSLWVEFDDIHVSIESTVDGMPVIKQLTKGYYYCADDTIDTDEWDYLGAGWDTIPVADRNPNDAEWYLIHYGYDEFEIVIPWMDDYTFTGVQSATHGYQLTFDLDENDGNTILSESIYDSPANVVVNYSAAVGPDAANSPAKNSATLDWVTPEGTFGPDDPQTTETKVYNMGITKTANDGTSTSPATRLAGAVFKLYKNYDPATKTYSDPVNVIPTNNEGVYILDDIDTVISGTNKITSREMYATHWEDWIAADPEPETSSTVRDEQLKANRRNDVVTPANGQLVILGLEAGTYYLQETKAPEGYNQLVDPVTVEVGTGSTAVYDNGYKSLPTATDPGHDVTYTVYSTVVVNNRGVELPSTGGVGTMMLITFGTLVVIAFAILLITHKKMTIYRD